MTAFDNFVGRLNIYINMTNKTDTKYEIKSNAIMYYGMSQSKPNQVIIEIELDGEIDRNAMENSVTKAIKRYPYFNVLLIEQPDRLVLDENTNKIRLHDSIHDDNTNKEGFLFTFSAEGNILKVVFEHALTDGHGFMPYLKTILSEYYSSIDGNTYTSSVINPSEGAVNPEEYTEPLSMLKEEYKTLKPAETPTSVYMLPEDDGDHLHCHSFFISVKNSEMQELVSRMGGSYTSVLSALMTKAIQSVHTIPEDKNIVCTNIIDRKPLLRCPNSHYLSMHPAHYVVANLLLKQPLSALVDAIRTDLHEKMKGDVYALGFQLKQFIDYICSLPSLEQKRQMCQHIVSNKQNVSTFTVSYWGVIDYDKINEKVLHMKLQASPQSMLIEACAHGDTFDITLLLTFESDIYKNEFVSQLQMQGLTLVKQSLN